MSSIRIVSGTLSKSAGTKTTTSSLHFKVELKASFDRTELETGEVLRDTTSYTSTATEGAHPAVSVNMYQESRGRAKVDEGTDRIGSIRYHGPRESAFSERWPSSISIVFYLDDVEYGRLVDAVSRGVLPKSFMVSEVSGI